MTFSLIWLPGVLRAAGLKVSEVSGWADRGLSDVGPTKGVICHHTATQGGLDNNMPTLNALINGRKNPPLRGPLAQMGLGRDGTFYVVAAGFCQHAGPGQWKGVTTGNTNFIGIEGENDGIDGDAWPDVQMDAYRRGVAAILKQIGQDSSWCCGHKEWAPTRKTDPSFSMTEFRTEVASIMAGTAMVRPLIPAADPADPTGKPTLQRGSRGDPVKAVQAKLALTADGIFGPGTEAAVRAFQRSKNVVPDGIVGPKTWALMGA